MGLFSTLRRWRKPVHLRSYELLPNSNTCDGLWGYFGVADSYLVIAVARGLAIEATIYVAVHEFGHYFIYLLFGHGLETKAHYNYDLLCASIFYAGGGKTRGLVVEIRKDRLRGTWLGGTSR